MILLAKSPNARGESLSLLQHLLDVEQAVQLVFPEGSRWRANWTRFFKIPSERQSEFWRTLGVAALLHDIGKANDDFLLAVKRRGYRQSIRHEHLSALILCTPQFREWLVTHGVDPDLVTAAVLSHHIKAADTGDHEYAWCQSRERDRVVLHLHHPDVRSLLKRVATRIGASSAPRLPEEPWTPGAPWSEVFKIGRANAKKFSRALAPRKQDTRRQLLAALKAGIVAADAVASAVVREGKPMREWLAHNAHLPAITPEEVETAIIGPRARQIEAKARKPFALHAFQRLAGAEGPRTMLLAPCGAGKTMAAWEWAKHQATFREFGRVIFLYPTRGTASEGFRDYVGWAPEGDATLLHGSSAFELTGIADNPPEALAGKDLSKAEAEARMFALGLWRFRFYSATVDQFLSFMQNRYQSLCLLPALADSAVILDEVHSYDRTMFDLLLSFLREFDVPVLCMTATLPNQRRQRLEAVGLTPFPRPEHGVDLEDLAASAEHPRYSIEFVEEADSAVNAAIRRSREGKRVLLVVNRVARCLEVATRIQNAVGSLPLVYHSRFRLMDRQERHRDVVAAFKAHEPAIAVTTQVCEMSLDLDAQVLVTELAPVPSLIQRFGRANRHLIDRNVLAEILVYPPAKAAPYQKCEIDTARTFIETVKGVGTQARLAEALETGGFSPPEPSFGDAGLFLAGGYFAVPGSFRDEDDHSMQCVCDGDLLTVEGLFKRGDPIDGYLLPAPRKQVLDVTTSLPRHIGVVASEDYCPQLGLKG